MAKAVERRKGTATEHASFTGNDAEITVNTTNKSVHVHDGATAGGVELARADLANTDLTATITELNYTDGVTSNIQTQLDAMVEKSGDTMTGDLSLGDNVKAKFGASDDLQIYHDGTASYITDTGTGTLNIKASGSIRLRGNDTDELLARFNENGSNQFYYDNAEKLATTSTGVDVTGTVSADGLTVEGSELTLTSSTYAGLKIDRADANTEQVLYLAPVADTVGSYIQNNASYASSYLYTPESEKSCGIEFNRDGSLHFRADNGLTVGTNFRPTDRMRITPDGYIHMYEDTGTTPKLTWSSSTESLGIGVTNPNRSIEIKQSTPAIRLTDTAADDYAEIVSTNGDLLLRADEGNTHSNSLMRFEIDGSERARIDSSGNLLVSTTNTAPATNNIEGICLRNEGHINVSRASGVVGYFNRKTNDGAILEFLKDGTKVGSINTNSGGLSFNSSGSQVVFSASGVGYHLDSTTLRTFSGNDGNVNLGLSNSRFKDLYLSGGVYLGGTGSVNKLDDYETGTFTPTFIGSGLSVTYDSQHGYYVKVGNAVHFRIQLGTDSVSGGSPTTNLSIGGLPFASNNYAASGALGFCYGTAENINNARWLATTGSTLVLYTNSTTTSFENVHTDALGATTNNNRLYVSGTYFTDS